MGRLTIMLFSIGFIMVMLSGMAAGQALYQQEQYPFGAEGLKAATAPPPGVYYRNYQLYYCTDTLTDSEGDKIKPLDLKLSVYANVSRVIWVTKKKLLGADFLMDVFIPIFIIISDAC